MDIEPALEDSNKDLEANNDEDFYVRGTRYLAKKHRNCNLVIVERSNFQDDSRIKE